MLGQRLLHFLLHRGLVVCVVGDDPPLAAKLIFGRSINHCHTLAGGTPVFALDMYEHSYHMDFGAKAASYVDTFMDVIRWNNVERLPRNRGSEDICILAIILAEL
jgi:superoxide dismutase